MAECLFPLCTRHAESNGYCIPHRMYAKETGEKVKRKEPPVKTKQAIKPIAVQSEKAKKESPAYRKFIAEFLAKPENKYCNIQIDENCTKVATTVNHTRRRGKNSKMNEENCEPSCSYCNIKIEEKDGWAREHGHLKSKFSPKNQTL